MAGLRPHPRHASPAMTIRLGERVNHFVSWYDSDWPWMQHLAEEAACAVAIRKPNSDTRGASIRSYALTGRSGPEPRSEVLVATYRRSVRLAQPHAPDCAALVS